MRKLSLLLSMAVVAMSVLFTSCSDDESVDAVGPSINFVGASEVNETVTIGSTDPISFDIITVRGDVNIDRITFRVNGAALAEGRITISSSSDDEMEVLGADSEYSVPNSEDAGATYTIYISPNTVVGTENIQIAVVDNDNEQAGLSVTLTTAEEVTSTPLEAALNGVLYHVLGTEPGSYDLLSNSNVSSTMANDAVSDLRNTDEALSFNGSFTGAQSGTTFIASTLDPATATQEDLMAAYMGGSPVDAVMNPSEGDIYVFLTRRDGNMRPGILWVTAIDAQDGSNDGSLSFSYRLAQ